jgi:hypothetical protein
VAEIKEFYIQMRDRYRNPIHCCARETEGQSRECKAHLVEGCKGKNGEGGHDKVYNQGTNPRLRVAITMKKKDGSKVDVDLRCMQKKNCGNEIRFADDCSDNEQMKPLYDLRAPKADGKKGSGPCGVFKVKYSTLVAGQYSVNIGVAESAAADSNVIGVANSPFAVTVSPESEPDTVSSTAYGTGLSVTFAGEVARFWVQAKDKYSNDKLKPGDEFYAAISYGDGKSTIKVTTLSPNQGCPKEGESPNKWVYGKSNVITNCDLKNSTYVFAYVATVAGDYSISITHEGEHIKNPNDAGKPCKMIAMPSVTNTTRTTAGSLQTASELGTFETVTAGVRENFTIQARDSFNNRRITGGDVVKANVWFLGESRVVPKAPLNKINIYTCSDKSHAHHYNWDKATETCDGPERWIEYTFQNSAAVALNKVVNASDANDGVYQLEYVSSKTGFYHLDIYMLPLYGKGSYLQIPASPFTIFVEPAPASPLLSFVFGDGLISTGPGANITTIESNTERRSVTVVGVDAYGNERRKPGDPFGATLTITPFASFGSSSNGNQFTEKVAVANSEFFGGGKHNVTYKPTVAGRYNIAVFLGPIQNQAWNSGKGFDQKSAQVRYMHAIYIVYLSNTLSIYMHLTESVLCVPAEYSRWNLRCPLLQGGEGCPGKEELQLQHEKRRQHHREPGRYRDAAPRADCRGPLCRDRRGHRRPCHGRGRRQVPGPGT